VEPSAKTPAAQGPAAVPGDAPGAGSFRVERPAAEAATKTIDEAPLRSIESIPTPELPKAAAPAAPEVSPTVAPPAAVTPPSGPSVELSAPRAEPKAADTKVEESSTLRPIRVPSDDRTT
jgi:hypothetical protein